MNQLFYLLGQVGKLCPQRFGKERYGRPAFSGARLECTASVQVFNLDGSYLAQGQVDNVGWTAAVGAIGQQAPVCSQQPGRAVKTV